MEERSDERYTGVLFPVFSMRRAGDLGIGDTSAVMQCLRWLAGYEVNFLQLLPINVTGKDRSPYSALSSVALEPSYLDVERVAGVQRESVERARAMLGSSQRVNYEKVVAVKESILREAYACEPQQDELDKFKAKQGAWLDSYVRYRWLMDQAGGEEDWQLWPKSFSSLAGAQQYEERCRGENERVVQWEQDYYAWQQMHAFHQWGEVRRYSDALGVRLMGDVPIGVSSASADVFFEPEWFIPGWYGGAPPERGFTADAFTGKWGQNWGVPLYDWAHHEGKKFSWWRRRIGKLVEVFQMYRVDHILGFYRIYAFPWHPRENGRFLPMSLDEAGVVTGGNLPGFKAHPDDTEVNKQKNLEAGDRYLRAVLDAGGSAEVIGEDLGCVPDYVRPHLKELGVAGFRICHWELDEIKRVCEPESHDECAFAVYSTHDMEPIKALWDQAVSTQAESDDAQDLLAILSDFAGLDQPANKQPYPPFSVEIKRALMNALMRSGARYTALLINEVIDDAERINLPGTVGEHNWTYRVLWDFENIPDRVVGNMEELRDIIRATGRGKGHCRG